MLGCQDFCGYYDWTFSFIRQAHGPQAVRDLWSDAIAADSQRHYEQAGRAQGLAGLYRAWVRTGIDEHCDWTFTLDESRNVLAWNMYRCPSKGFLLDNDLNADEDYCDHCMGWIAPMLERIGMEMVGHEHNHCGQCWGEMAVRGRPHRSPELDDDIRRDPRWNRGYLDRWSHGRKLPILEEVSSSADVGDVLSAWFSRAERLLVLGRGPTAAGAVIDPAEGVLVTETTYVTRDVFAGEPVAVLFSDLPQDLDLVARRFLATPPGRRPLLLHTYLPRNEPADYVSLGLPRPVPLLPWLIRQGLYRHAPNRPYPTSGVFLVLLAVTLQRPTRVLGVDLYRHPTGRIYAADAGPSPGFVLPDRHSLECDQYHLELALQRAGSQLVIPDHVRDGLPQP
jgi:hypothetical protein